MTLIVITLGLNFIALQIVKKYRVPTALAACACRVPVAVVKGVSRIYGRIAIGIALAFLVTLFVSRAFRASSSICDHRGDAGPRQARPGR